MFQRPQGRLAACIQRLIRWGSAHPTGSSEVLPAQNARAQGRPQLPVSTEPAAGPLICFWWTPLGAGNTSSLGTLWDGGGWGMLAGLRIT